MPYFPCIGAQKTEWVRQIGKKNQAEVETFNEAQYTKEDGVMCNERGNILDGGANQVWMAKTIWVEGLIDGKAKEIPLTVAEIEHYKRARAGSDLKWCNGSGVMAETKDKHPHAVWTKTT